MLGEPVVVSLNSFLNMSRKSVLVYLKANVLMGQHLVETEKKKKK